MKSKKFKTGNDSIEFIPDTYTKNELNIRITNLSYAVTTMITKSALVRFGQELEAGNTYVMSCESDYESYPLFSATKAENGYIFLVKCLVEISIELPNEIAKDIAGFLKQIKI